MTRFSRLCRMLLPPLTGLLLSACASGDQRPWEDRPPSGLAAHDDDHVVVRNGDTLSEIADDYGLRTETLARANGIHAPYDIYPGQRLVVPSRDDPTPARTRAAEPRRPRPTTVASAPIPRPRSDSYYPVPWPKPRSTELRPTTVVQTSAPPTNVRFDWPLQGRVISAFGPRGNGLYNDGINIETAEGAPVRAAGDGVVKYSGNQLRGYGNLLLIEHDNGYVTAYAHNDRLVVQRGAHVRRGQIIAYAGKTGSVESPQLHFEIRRGTSPVDPRPYLVALR